MAAYGQGLVEATLHLQDDFDLGAFRPPQSSMDKPASVCSAQPDLTPDPLSCIKHDTWVSDLSLEWLSPWSVEELKRVGAKWGGGTINDVSLTIISGALRSYMHKKGNLADSLNPHFIQPAGLPRPATLANGFIGNSFGLVRIPLHSDLADPFQRFLAISRDMKTVKNSSEAADAENFIKNNAYLTVEEKTPSFELLSGQNSVLVSNLRGPSQPLSILGHPLNKLRWFGPRFGNIGIQFPLISYTTELTVGIVADRSLIPDLSHLKDVLELSYKEVTLP